MSGAAKNILAGGLTAALAFVAYVRTLCPTVSAGDSGELVLAAVAIGVPHPPGYPVFVLLGRLAVSVGDALGAVEPAMMTNAMCALCSALVAGGTCMVLRRCGAGYLFAAAAGLVLAFGSVFWGHAVTTEVYATASLGFVAILAAVESIDRTGTRSPVRLAAFLAGLMLTLHQVLVLVLPALVAVSWRRLRSREFPVLAGLFALGLSPYLLLMVRSAADPAIDWGDPETPARLLALVLRRGYGELGQNPLSPGLFAGNLLVFFSRVLDAFPLPVLLFALPGMRWLGSRRPLLSRFMLLSFLSLPLGLTLILRPAVDSVHAVQLAPFVFPVDILVAVWVGCGWVAVGDWLRARASAGGLGAVPAGRTRVRFAAGVVYAAAVLSPVWLFAHNLGRADRHDFFDARVYGENLLRCANYGATLVADGDNEAFVLAYVTTVLGVRPDVEVVHRKGYVFDAPRYLRRSPRRDLERNARRFMDDVLATRPDVVAATFVAPERFGGRELEREGIVFRPRAGRAAERRGPRTRSLLRSCDMQVLERDPDTLDFLSRKFAIGYLEALWDWRGWGGSSIVRGADDPPQLLAAIARFGRDFPEAQYFVGFQKERAGDLAGAWRHYALSARLDPGAQSPREGMARLAALAGATNR